MPTAIRRSLAPLMWLAVLLAAGTAIGQDVDIEIAVEEVAEISAGDTAWMMTSTALVLLMTLALCIPLYRRRYQPWLAPLAKTIFHAQNWSMVEVFIIGVIVSLVKIAAMATVVLGLSFWAYAAFTICFTVTIANLDRYQCWELLEALEKSR